VAAGNPEAAAAAHQQAIDVYAAYRRAGGESRTTGAQLCALVFQGLQQEATEQAEQTFNRWLERDDTPPEGVLLIHKLRSILADNPALDYDDAVELRLLLEALGD
jgi:hypothetical protein